MQGHDPHGSGHGDGAGSAPDTTRPCSSRPRYTPGTAPFLMPSPHTARAKASSSLTPATPYPALTAAGQHVTQSLPQRPTTGIVSCRSQRPSTYTRPTATRLQPNPSANPNHSRYQATATPQLAPRATRPGLSGKARRRNRNQQHGPGNAAGNQAQANWQQQALTSHQPTPCPESTSVRVPMPTSSRPKATPARSRHHCPANLKPSAHPPCADATPPQPEAKPQCPPIVMTPTGQ